MEKKVIEKTVKAMKNNAKVMKNESMILLDWAEAESAEAESEGKRVILATLDRKPKKKELPGEAMRKDKTFEPKI